MQLAYKNQPFYGCEGERSDASTTHIVSRINDGEQTIPHGHLVAFGKNSKTCALAQNKEDVTKPLGVALHEKRLPDFEKGEMLSILRQGRVFVCLESDVKSPGDGVYTKSKTAGFGGKKENETILLKGACFLSAGKEGDVIEMEIDFMGGVL
jgi:hypothetical protein